MPKRTLHLDEELFVKALARAVEEGDARFIDGHVPRLDVLVDARIEPSATDTNTGVLICCEGLPE